MKFTRILIIFSMITICATLVAYAGGGGYYGSGNYKGGKDLYGRGGFKSDQDSYRREGIKSSEGTNPDKGTASHSITLGQELIDLEAAYKKGLLNEEQYNRLKKIIIDQKTGKGK